LILKATEVRVGVDCLTRDQYGIGAMSDVEYQIIREGCENVLRVLERIKRRGMT
jgi:hypothetical protein